MGGTEYAKSTEGQYGVEVGHNHPLFGALPHWCTIGKRERVNLGLTYGMELCRVVQDMSLPRRLGEIPFLATHRRWSMATQPHVAWTYTGGALV